MRVRHEIRGMLLALALPVAAGVAVGGCDRQEGAFEEAGEAMDETAEQAKEKAGQMGESMEEAAEKAKEEAEEMGKAMEEKTREATGS